ncbi:hypothetical protein [Spirochaeta cellobiosiphila]|uniref:hypothetical protein n=1 Tax=Spirochaeta cellobiosiphila TaxID=504483 RepID=UPI00041155B9|nr:hypothetical protein [Spirochaeta cellobiosiphila]
MKLYEVKGKNPHKEYLKVLGETKNGLEVLMIRIKEDYTSEKREILPKELFETCLRTQYLVESSNFLSA